MIYAATGHRLDKLGGYDRQVDERLIRFAIAWLSTRKDAKAAISGLALGWDTAFAFAALSCDIPLIGAVPFVGQESKWPVEARARYRYLLGACATVHVVSPGGYANVKFQKRNRWMVDRCGTLAALWNGTAGGTANCVNYAATKSLLVTTINLWDQWTEFK